MRQIDPNYLFGHPNGSGLPSRLEKPVRIYRNSAELNLVMGPLAICAVYSTAWGRWVKWSVRMCGALAVTRHPLGLLFDLIPRRQALSI